MKMPIIKGTFVMTETWKINHYIIVHLSTTQKQNETLTN